MQGTAIGDGIRLPSPTRLPRCGRYERAMAFEMTSTHAPRRPSRVRHSARYLVSHRRLLFRVTRSELSSRYAGSILGVGWTIVYPVIFLGIYSLVYLYIFRLSPKG